MRRITTGCLACAVLTALWVHVAGGQELFRDQMTSGAAWSTIAVVPADTTAAFDYDYSQFGIPEAPNSRAGDSATRGLRLQANLIGEAVNGVAAFPTGGSFTGNYKFQFDMWVNTIGPFPDGGAGSTQFGGGSVGFNDAAASILSGAGFHVSGEAGSSFDYRLYANGERQNYATHEDPDTSMNDLYDPKMIDILPPPCTPVSDECGGDNADGNAYVQGQFPGLEPPLKQQMDFPLDQFGTTKNGAAAFQWMTVMFTVDTVAGTAFVQMASATSGNTADIGTFTLDNTYVDRTTIDQKIITSFEGNVSLLYRDPFDSITIEPSLMFGIFDNVLVTQLSAPGMPGDFNNDTKVDAGDYTTWRDALGSNFDLNGNGDEAGASAGVVDQADYDLWKAHYGDTPGSGAGVAVAAPEPGSLVLVVLAILATTTLDRRFGPLFLRRCQH